MAVEKIQKMQSPLLVEEVDVGTGTISANSGVSVSGSVAKSGYTPIGIVGIRKTGQVYAQVVVSQFYLGNDDEIIRIALCNTTASDKTYHVYAEILYQRN